MITGAEDSLSAPFCVDWRAQPTVTASGVQGVASQKQEILD